MAARYKIASRAAMANRAYCLDHKNKQKRTKNIEAW